VKQVVFNSQKKKKQVYTLKFQMRHSKMFVNISSQNKIPAFGARTMKSRDLREGVYVEEPRHVLPDKSLFKAVGVDATDH
jgi:hypothetical protein